MRSIAIAFSLLVVMTFTLSACITVSPSGGGGGGTGGGGAPAAQIDQNTDRPGMDYNHFQVDTYNDCYQACLNDPACRTFTYVKPGVQGPKAMCWLKNGIPNPKPNNDCTSGVIRW